jgi:hypothetical protein
MAKQNLDRLKMIDEKMEQLKAQKAELLSREKKKERAARTRRLIQNGALAEQYLNVQEMDPPDFELFLKTLISIVPNFDTFTVEARQSANLPLQPDQGEKRRLVTDEEALAFESEPDVGI